MLERERKEQTTAAHELWNITKPSDPQQALHYGRKLFETISMHPFARYRHEFGEDKDSGGQRIIIPADEPLKTVQVYLSKWIGNNFPATKDYCYGRRSTYKAIDEHKESSYAFVCDLKSAFDQVTAKKIKNWFHYHDRRLEGQKLDILTDLLTLEGIAPQGCSSTPFVYNVVVGQMDEHLEVVGSALGAEKYTRYSDNICFSSRSEFDQKEMELQVRRVTRGFGFDLSWTRNCDPDTGIIYLGAKIDEGKVVQIDERLGKRLFRVYGWLAEENPEKHKHEATGLLSWSRKLSGEYVNPELLEALTKYFNLIGEPDTVDRLMNKVRS